MKPTRARLALSILALAFAGPLALNNTLNAQTNPYDGMADVSVRPGWRAADGSHIAALEITLQPGWKTYWRAPGDAGIPPLIIWANSRNIQSVRINWPTPTVFDQNGMRSVGYREKLILPLTITLKNPAQAADLSGRVQIGICNQVCVPVEIGFNQPLGPTKTKADPKIAAALADRPYSATEAKVSNVTCRVTPSANGVFLVAQIKMPASGDEFVIIEPGDPAIWAGEATVTRQGQTLTATSELAHSSGAAFALDRSAIRITVLGKHHATDIRGCPAG